MKVTPRFKIIPYIISSGKMNMLKYGIVLLVTFCLYLPDIHAQYRLESSDLPIILIETNGQSIVDDPRIVAEMKVINNPAGELNYPSDPANDFSGKIEIEIRGSTSQSFPKKSYAFETEENNGQNCNVCLIDMPKENDWILYGPYSDKSLIRNALAYQLSREMGQYASRSRFCELIINEEYAGVYVLTEKIKQDKNRVDISEIDSDDNAGDSLTGGYILKIDRIGTNGCSGWRTPVGLIYMNWHDPDCVELTDEQEAYSKNFIAEFENALFSDGFSDPVNGYLPFIDANSFFDYLIVNELAKNIDAYRISTFMYKDRDSKGGKLIMGPVWDFNIAFGNVDYLNGFRTDSLQAFKFPWWNRFLQDSVFSKNLRERWIFHRHNSLSIDRIFGIIDSMTTVLEEAQRRNFKRWDILNTDIWPNYYIGGNYYAEIDYLKGWLVNRLNWLDNYFENYAAPATNLDNYSLVLYPNPLSDFFTIEFKLNSDASVSFKIFDYMGQLRNVIMDNQPYEAGIHKWTYYMEDNGSELPSGIYYLMMEVDARQASGTRILRY
jgi:hypothetical protein